MHVTILLQITPEPYLPDFDSQNLLTSRPISNFFGNTKSGEDMKVLTMFKSGRDPE